MENYAFQQRQIRKKKKKPLWPFEHRFLCSRGALECTMKSLCGAHARLPMQSNVDFRVNEVHIKGPLTDTPTLGPTYLRPL